MKSIRRQLTSRFLAAFALLLGAGAAAIYFSARISLYRELDRQLTFKALAMAVFTKPGRDELEVELPRRSQTMSGAAGLVEHYALFSTNGVALAASPSLQNVPLTPRFGPLNAPQFWNLTLPDGTQGRAIGLEFLAKPPPPKPKPIREEKDWERELEKQKREWEKEKEREKKEKELGREFKAPPAPLPIGLVVATSRAEVSAQLNQLLLILLGAGSLTLLATALIVPRLLRQGLSPLDQLAQQAAGIDASRLRTRFPTHSMPSELLPIAHRLNDVLARLEGSFERERRFSADLAHELRTPIAGLRATAEVALQWPDQAGPDSWLAVRELAAQMERLAACLLTLARSEQKSLPLEIKRVPLQPLLDAVLQPRQSLVAAKGLALRASLPPDAALATDETLLRGILANLVGNAVDYSPPAETVEISFLRHNGHFELAVSNPAPGLEAQDVSRIFDRFWRKDAARADAEHLGLGLSLAQSFAALLGCQLSAHLTPDRRLRLILAGQDGKEN